MCSPVLLSLVVVVVDSDVVSSTAFVDRQMELALISLTNVNIFWLERVAWSEMRRVYLKNTVNLKLEFFGLQ